MKMSVREARAQFARALSVAEGGERVTITKNGKPIAEIGPPTSEPDDTGEDYWDRLMRVRNEMGLGEPAQDPRTDEEWLADFDGPEWRKTWDDYHRSIER